MLFIVFTVFIPFTVYTLFTLFIDIQCSRCSQYYLLVMPKKKNRFGLSRDIPDKKKRAIRQACGFGCIVCGCMLFEYAHSDPPFEDAKTHDPEKIKLLCKGCHGKFDKGLIAR